ncbi:MAG TPA: asparagine synthase (glutamine-hydrolyzing) [Bryobacterales bacterium]|nr:asparagine synthase (glutamine-hydrolyzing) [Bryobacterales bacterium]
MRGRPQRAKPVIGLTSWSRRRAGWHGVCIAARSGVRARLDVRSYTAPGWSGGTIPQPAEEHPLAGETQPGWKRACEPMCGIAGVLNFYERADPALLRTMIGLIRHRGPDATAVYCESHAGLAHARLSIIDIAGGCQPMQTEDGSLSITFNGEIFNYLELRAELLEQGHRFRTQSDTEVILHLYRQYGEDCVSRMNGQWAFAIWDARRQRLFLSRDRLGIRPLFYTVTGRAFVFGSEIKAVLGHPGVSRALDLDALDDIFTFWCRVPPRTIFQNVQELPPGHSMAVDGRDVRVWPYWRLEFNCAPHPERDSAERLFALLVDATRIRLRSDVPVGAYLSGGLDSTITTALIRKFSDSRLKTFSVSFDDPGFDESAYQREAVRFLETDHEEVRCTGREIAAVFPEVVWHVEQPVLRTAPAPMYLLSRLAASNGYKVVLTGEGSDEMLGGYDIFKEAKIRRFWAAHPDSRIRPLLLRRLYPYLPELQRQSNAYLRAFFRIRPEELQKPFFSHAPRWELTAGLKLFFSDQVKSGLATRDCYAALEALLPPAYFEWDGFSQSQYLEASYLLPGYILSSQGDRVAMAHGVECRMPFLDYRVVEFAAALPPPLKMRGLNEKYLLKECVNGLIPKSIKQRAKQPYRAPEARSFFEGAPYDYVEELLSPGRLKQDGIFNPAPVQGLINRFRWGGSGSIRDNMALIGILSTQLVIDQFIRSFSKRSGYGNT